METDEEGRQTIVEEVEEEFNGEDEFELEQFDRETGCLHLIKKAEN